MIDRQATSRARIGSAWLMRGVASGGNGYPSMECASRSSGLRVVRGKRRSEEPAGGPGEDDGATEELDLGPEQRGSVGGFGLGHVLLMRGTGDLEYTRSAAFS